MACEVKGAIWPKLKSDLGTSCFNGLGLTDNRMAMNPFSIRLKEYNEHSAGPSYFPVSILSSE